MSVNIVLTNQKGGVGKTTTSAALASGLGKAGYRVLAVDLDPQGNLGFSLGMDQEEGDIYEVLTGQKTAGEALHHAEECDILPSSMLLSALQEQLKQDQTQLLLKQCLSSVEKSYDFVIIDTPPALNILTVNAYAAASGLIIPMGADILSLVGLSQLRETVDAVRAQINPGLRVMGILLTRYNARTRLSRDVAEMAQEVADQLDSRVFEARIRNAVAVSEAPAHGESVLSYAPRSGAASDYAAFVKEVLQGIHWQGSLA